MELIYFWIEKYKNLTNIEANINPKYFCKINIDNDNSTIDLDVKTKKITNIFSAEKINVIAILGQNGSGKTNFINALTSVLRSPKALKSTMDYYEYILPQKYFLLYKINGQYKYKISFNNNLNFKIQLKINSKKTKCELDVKSYKVAYFKPFLNKEDEQPLQFPKNENLEEILKIKLNNYFYYDRFRIYDTAHTLRQLYLLNKTKKFKFLQDNKYLTFEKYGYELNIQNEFEWLNNQLYSKQIYFRTKREDLNKFINNIMQRNKHIIDLATSGDIRNINDFKNQVLSQGCFTFFVIQLAELFNHTEGGENIVDISTLYEYTNSLSNIKNYEHSQLATIYLKTKQKIKEEFKDETLLEYINNYNDDFLKDMYNVLDTYIEMENYLSTGKSFYIDQLEISEKSIVRLKKAKMMLTLSKKNLNMPESIAKLNNLKIFRLNYYNNMENEIYSFLQLSTGEQRILRFFADIVSLLSDEITTFIYDEMDLSWHPEWQRNMIYYAADIFKKLTKSKNTNLIFSTHSPFILSDVPKNNTIIFKNNKITGKVSVQKALKETFGANIYELFNDSFYMTSTIGEFAKNKIEEMIDDISKIQNYKDFQELESRINVIGEPILKNKILEKLYKDKFIEYGSKDNSINMQALGLENKKLKNELKAMKIKYEKNKF